MEFDNKKVHDTSNVKTASFDQKDSQINVSEEKNQIHRTSHYDII